MELEEQRQEGLARAERLAEQQAASHGQLQALQSALSIAKVVPCSNSTVSVHTVQSHARQATPAVTWTKASFLKQVTLGLKLPNLLPALLLCSARVAVLDCYASSTQAELREAAEARDACKEALDLAQQGLADLEAALARESAAGEDCAKEVCFHFFLTPLLLKRLMLS